VGQFILGKGGFCASGLKKQASALQASEPNGGPYNQFGALVHKTVGAGKHFG
jgi:hypothetical protein